MRYNISVPEPLTKSSAKKLMAEARRHLGEPYGFGGASRKGWDCSGFVHAVYGRALSVTIPRTAHEMFARSYPLSVSRGRPGDLVFFQIKSRKPSHVGIYLGRFKFIHVSSSDGIIISSLDDPYYRAAFLGIRRLSLESLAQFHQ
jgi:D-gamma-glutamyl-meso-diaminopimelic acid endopeptidase CwlS/peptidoglycan endopeptidase LytE